MIFASPTIYIPNYEDNSNQQNEFNIPQFSARQMEGNKEEGISQGFRERSLTTIYGQNVFMNQKYGTNTKHGKQSAQVEYTNERTISYLNENLEEIDDDMLKMMPLLKNLGKQNVIPIMDFEDNT